MPFDELTVHAKYLVSGWVVILLKPVIRLLTTATYLFSMLSATAIKVIDRQGSNVVKSAILAGDFSITIMHKHQLFGFGVGLPYMLRHLLWIIFSPPTRDCFMHLCITLFTYILR